MKFGSPIPRKRSRIEIIPLIDVMFFLLASFMMVSLNMSKLEAIKVDAPPAFTGEKDIQADVFNIALDRQGRVYLGETNATLPQLAHVLSNRFLRSGYQPPVFVTGDKETPHGAILSVLDLVRRSGVIRVSFAVTPDPGKP